MTNNPVNHSQSAKVLNRDNLVSILKDLKQQQKKIVTYNGSFDLLHAGHVKSIHEAKTQGDVLIIPINSDSSIKKYKGPHRPIVTLSDRIELLAALEDVDYIIPFDEINPKEILSLIKPAIHCNGSDWGENCIERAVVEENGGKIHILQWQEGLSTTKLIKKILTAYTTPVEKAVFIDRDGTINHNKEGYTYAIDDFVFLPGVVAALQKLSQTDYKIIIVSNQSGISRGYYTEADFRKLTDWMINSLNEQKVRIDKVYYCPHLPDANCACRKPGVGMLLDAVHDFGISLNDSWMIGDDEKDIIMGREANVKTIKIGEKMSENLRLKPNFYAKSLSEAVTIIEKYAK